MPPPAPAHTLWAVSPCPALLYRLGSFPPTPTRHRWLPLPEPRCQIGQPPHGPHIANREGIGLRLPDQDDELLAPHHPGVEQIARQHRVVLGRQRETTAGYSEPWLLCNEIKQMASYRSYSVTGPSRSLATGEKVNG